VKSPARARARVTERDRRRSRPRAARTQRDPPLVAVLDDLFGRWTPERMGSGEREVLADGLAEYGYEDLARALLAVKPKSGARAFGNGHWTRTNLSSPAAFSLQDRVRRVLDQIRAEGASPDPTQPFDVWIVYHHAIQPRPDKDRRGPLEATGLDFVSLERVQAWLRRNHEPGLGRIRTWHRRMGQVILFPVRSIWHAISIESDRITPRQRDRLSQRRGWRPRLRGSIRFMPRRDHPRSRRGDQGVERHRGGGLILQSLVFRKPRWRDREARAWALSHGYVAPKTDETTNTIRIRQRAPRDFDPASFRTVRFGQGIQAVMGKPRRLLAFSRSPRARSRARGQRD
jgi:hypothetical protein